MSFRAFETYLVMTLVYLGLSAIWLGCNAASKDIVGELAIYRREHDINSARKMRP